MESVFRQFVSDGDTVLIIRNGYFSYRWTDIIEQVTNSLGAKSHRRSSEGESREDGDQWPRVQPMAIEDVEKLIEKHKPRVVFAPHVETSTGVELPLEYIKVNWGDDEEGIRRNFRIGWDRRRNDVD